jgi:hypothetical protein
MNANECPDDQADRERRHDQRKLRRANDRTDEQPLDQNAESGGDNERRRHHHRKGQAVGTQHQRDIGAERHQLALGEVQDATCFERDRQRQRNDCVDATDAEPG